MLKYTCEYICNMALFFLSCECIIIHCQGTVLCVNGDEQGYHNAPYQNQPFLLYVYWPFKYTVGCLWTNKNHVCRVEQVGPGLMCKLTRSKWLYTPALERNRVMAPDPVPASSTTSPGLASIIISIVQQSLKESTIHSYLIKHVMPQPLIQQHRRHWMHNLYIYWPVLPFPSSSPHKTK